MKTLIMVSALMLIITTQVVNAQNDEVYIDVRTWVEHKVNNIDGDTRIHVSEIVEGVSEQFPDKQTPIRLYCERGVRAETALQRLEAAGYLNVKNLGGIEDVRKSRFSDTQDG